jgi:hypothetical protein
MEEVNIVRTQYIGIITSLVFLIFIVQLIRKGHLKESYSILWLFFGLILLFFSIWRHGLDSVALFLGIAYPPAMLFIIMILGMLLVLIQYSIVITKQSLKIKKLSQEMGIIKEEMEGFKRIKKD